MSASETNDSPEARKYNRLHFIGNIFLAVGVVAWFPYMYLKYLKGLDVSVFPYLSVHLSGVIPGSIIRRIARARLRKLG